MKHLITILAVALIAVPAFAGIDFYFDNAADTTGWSPAWQSSGAYGTISTAVISGELHIYAEKTSATSAYFVLSYAKPPCGSNDTCWSFEARSITTIQPPWCYTKAYSRDSSWSWADSGVAANMASTTIRFLNRRSPMGVVPYQDIGIQISLGTNTGSFEFVMDNAFFGQTLIPVELIDFETSIDKAPMKEAIKE